MPVHTTLVVKLRAKSSRHSHVTDGRLMGRRLACLAPRVTPDRVTSFF